MHKLTAIDLFCGAGGVSEALKKDFTIVAAVEYNEVIAKTYELNHGKDHLIVKDITKITEDEWLDFTKLKKGMLDLLIATPPCQGFSKHSRKRSKENKDPRNNLINEIFKIVDLFEPKYILFENVNNIKNFRIFKNFLIKLSNIRANGHKLKNMRPSYHIRFEEVNASDYNVPQRRKRLIIIAKRIDNFPYAEAFIRRPKNSTPYVTNPHSIWPKKKIAPMLGEYLSKFNLPKLKAGETDNQDLLHTCRNLSETNIKRIRATPFNGGSRNHWPHELILDCHKEKKVSFGDVYGRMSYNDYAPTITCGFSSYSKGRFGHPQEDRAISLREGALIQTFPTSYKFTGDINGEIYKGSKDSIATQIGNAVPVNLAKNFISAILRDIKS